MRGPDERPTLLTPLSARISALLVIALCALFVAGEFTYEKKPYFGFDGFFAFYALVGFVSVIAVALLARLLRPMIGRREDYYGENRAGPHDAREETRDE